MLPLQCMAGTGSDGLGGEPVTFPMACSGVSYLSTEPARVDSETYI